MVGKNENHRVGQFDSVEANSFKLLGPDGTVRAILGTRRHRDEERIGLSLLDSAGRRRVEIYLQSDRPELELLDDEGQSRMSFGLHIDGPPSIGLVGSNGDCPSRS